MSGTPAQHSLERCEDLAHLGLFVREQIGRVHHVDNGGGVGLEHQQAPVLGFRAVDRVVVEVDPFVQGIERCGMATGEAGVEFSHG